MRDGTASCLEWCALGRQCVGDKAYTNFMNNKALTVKHQVLDELRKHFGTDKARIAHSEEVLGHAEELLRQESGDWHVVVPAAILHDVGIKPAEEKYGSASGHLQEKEGPPVARAILLRVGLKVTHIDEICDIIAHHHSPGKLDTLNFRIVYDADCLVNLRGPVKGKSREDVLRLIGNTFLTPSGKRAAERLFLQT